MTAFTQPMSFSFLSRRHSSTYIGSAAANAYPSALCTHARSTFRQRGACKMAASEHDKDNIPCQALCMQWQMPCLEFA